MKRLHFSNFLDFIWTWTLHLKYFSDCGWTWTEFFKNQAGSGLQNMAVCSSLVCLGQNVFFWHLWVVRKFLEANFVKCHLKPKWSVQRSSTGVYSAQKYALGATAPQRKGSQRCMWKIHVFHSATRPSNPPGPPFSVFQFFLCIYYLVIFAENRVAAL